MEMPTARMLKPPPPVIGDNGITFTPAWHWRGGQDGGPIRDWDAQTKRERDAARLRLATGAAPLSYDAWDWQCQVLSRLDRYIPPDVPPTRYERLYVTNFQGPGHRAQYIKPGHSTRSAGVGGRMSEHFRAANPHGWGLVTAWISPVLATGGAVEQKLLNALADVHDGPRDGERFYGMDFETAVDIAWSVFLDSDEHWLWVAEREQ